MPVSIGGSGFITGLDQGIDGVGIITATSFSGPLTGNVTGDLTSSGVSTVGQLNVGTGGTIITTTSGGLVGIGTISPNSLLELSTNATSAAGGVTVNNTNAAGYSTLQLKNSGASGKTYTVSVGGNTSGLANEFYVYDDTAAAKRFSIDSSGRVTMPYQVYFYARAAAANHVSGTIPYSLVDYNIGNHYNASTYNFTAPVAGVYNISFQFFSLVNAAGGADLQVNGTLTMRCGREGTETYYEGYSNSINKYLNVGDTVRVEHFTGSVHTNTPFSHFSAYLLG